MTHVIVVHGHRDPGKQIISRECIRRVLTAETIPADHIVFSGAGPSDPWGISEARQMYAIYRGQLPHTLDERSRSTIDNARQASIITWVLQATTITVVTSWWHLPRCSLAWRGTRRRVHLKPSPGHIRYVPGELAALARHLCGRAQPAPSTTGRAPHASVKD